jgi:CheY-like chemotaxis protein
MKKDFYIYKCLKEIHRLSQAKLVENNHLGILLILNTPGSLEHFMVHTDPDKIRSIFNKILGYMLGYTVRGSIEFGYKLGRDDRLSFYVYEASGLSAELINGREPGKEAGLLSEINRLLSGLGGRAWVERSPSGEKVFWFTLDILPPGSRDTEIPSETQAHPYPDWKRKTILVVDDVRTNLLLLEGFLIPTRARVISVDNGLKAVNAVKKNPSINFVLMDVRMPVLDGYEATRRIKRIKPWLPVVAISAYPGSAETEKWKKAGCDAFLGKPLNAGELIRTMQRLFKGVSMKA